MLPGINARVVPVAPRDSDRVIAHRLDGEHLQRGLVKLETDCSPPAFAASCRALRCNLRRGICRAGTAGRYSLVMPVLPVDLDAFGFGNGDVLGVRVRSVISVEQPLDVAHAGDPPHGRPRSSSCFLSRTSTVISTSAAVVIALGLGFQAADVGVLAKQHGSELFSIPGRSSVCTTILTGKVSLGGARPLDLDLALDVVHEILHVGANSSSGPPRLCRA